MSLYDDDDDVPIPRRTMVLFFVVDASASMKGSKISSVNEAISDAIPEVRELAESNADAQLKIAALKFSSGAEWLTPQGPVKAEKYKWMNVKVSGSADSEDSDLGAACLALNEKLSENAFMQEATGSFAPVIILMSDGKPTDDYEDALGELKQNKWFRKAIKVAVAIGGKDADTDVLEAFTGHRNSLLPAYNKETLIALIKLVSVRASEIASKSVNVSSDDDDEAESDSKQNAVRDMLVDILDTVSKFFPPPVRIAYEMGKKHGERLIDTIVGWFK